MKKPSAALSRPVRLRSAQRPAGALRRWAVAGAGAGLMLALLVLAPAHWLTRSIESQLGGRLLLEDARGTVWQGSARLALAAGPGSTERATLPGRVEWSVGPGLDGLHVTLRASCCTPEPLAALLTPGLSGLSLRVRDGKSEWPAALLTGLGTPWNTLQPRGDMRASTSGFEAQWHAGRLRLSGQAELLVQSFSSNLSALQPMGSYRLKLQGGDNASVSMDTLEGKLQLEGRGQWVGGRLRFTGEARAEPAHEAALANFLNIIGRRTGARSVITLG